MKKSSLTILLIAGCLMCLTLTSVAWSQEKKPAVSQRPTVNAGLPHVSPDGSHIAFVSDRDGATDLFVISSNGTGKVQLTHTPEYESPAGWTRDSKHVLFSVYANDISTLYKIGLDGPSGNNPREIGRFSGRSPTPSPDGKRVVYMAGSWQATRLMVALIGTKEDQRPQQITDGSSSAWNTHWSPDGKWLAFTGRHDSQSDLAIFVMNADGSERRQLTHIAPEEGAAQWPVWSPDGKRVAVQVNSRSSKNSAYIWIVEVANGEARKLGVHDETYLDETPSWFPDGKRIAFQSNRTGQMEIWIMNIDGSGQLQVTH